MIGENLDVLVSPSVNILDNIMNPAGDVNLFFQDLDDYLVNDRTPHQLPNINHRIVLSPLPLKLKCCHNTLLL